MTPLSRLFEPAVLAVSLVALAACNSSDDGTSSLAVVSSTIASTGATPVAIQERWFVYFADEATTGMTPVGTDLNGDTLTNAQVPVVRNIATGSEVSLGVAAQQVFVLNAQVYMVVDEGADGRNWETPTDLGTNDVLLHWSESAGVLTYVDTLEGDTLAQSGNLLFFASSTAAPSAATESNIRAIDAGSAPLLPVTLPTDDLVGGLEPIILGVDEGMIFLALDEPAEGRMLNTDGDTTDVFVLAVLDGTTVGGTIMNTGFAVASALVPFRAKLLGPGDWLIGFLVSEADQGNVSLNDFNDFNVAWQPMQCGATADTDALDQVLHYLTYATWAADPVMNPIRNTGIAGTRRVVAAANNVGTISPEADASCDLNDDTDQTDDVFRWAGVVAPGSPVLPVKDEGLLHAVFDIPGGTGGIGELDQRWVIALDEADDDVDIDGDTMMDTQFVGWYNPASIATAFTFSPTIGITWMQEHYGGSLLLLGFLERFGNTTNNDGDTTDTFPVWADFNGSFTALTFTGVARAVEPDNVGLVLQNNLAFFRVSEADDNRDWNGDAVLDDHVLFRSGIVPSFVTPVGDVTNDARPVIEVGRPTTFGGAFLGREASTLVDYNGDGDMVDVVVRYFRF